jgi:hypothetical protein
LRKGPRLAAEKDLADGFEMDGAALALLGAGTERRAAEMAQYERQAPEPPRDPRVACLSCRRACPLSSSLRKKSIWIFFYEMCEVAHKQGLPQAIARQTCPS